MSSLPNDFTESASKPNARARWFPNHRRFRPATWKRYLKHETRSKLCCNNRKATTKRFLVGSSRPDHDTVVYNGSLNHEGVLVVAVTSVAGLGRQENINCDIR